MRTSKTASIIIAFITIISFCGCAQGALQRRLTATHGAREYAWKDNTYDYTHVVLSCETPPNASKISFGTALVYTDGRNDFSTGNADYKRFCTAIYARMPLCGGVFTLAGAYGPVRCDYTIHSASGESTSDEFAFSALYVKRYPLFNGYWLEPQLHFLFARVNSDVSVADNGAIVQLERFDRAMGRLGLSIGKTVGNVNLRLRTALLHDLRGDLKVRLSTNGWERGHSVNLGGSWYRVGFGVDVRLQNGLSLFAILDKMWGGNVGANWQFNAGFSLDF